MAREEKGNRRKCDPRKGRNKKNIRPKAILVDALTHTVRREILRRLHADGARHHSPTGLALELGMKVPVIDYHMRVLQKGSVIKLMKEEKIRGATKYLYASLASDNAAVSAVLAFTEDEDKEVEAERRAREAEEAEVLGNGLN